MNRDEIHDLLETVGYCSNEDIDFAVMISMITNKPLLIEGAPGVGKTSLAKALAKAMDIPFIRLQMYDGLTDDKVLYDYDYQKQLLTLEAIKPALEKEFEGMTTNEIIHHTASKLDFYGRDFLIERPVLRAIVPKSLGGSDSYDNLVLITQDAHILVHATTEETIRKYCKKLNLNKACLKKLNKYREKVKNELIPDKILDGINRL